MKRILLVEDSPVIRAAAVTALSDAGYTVQAHPTLESVILDGVAGFDLILMDVQMPDLYGDDVAAVLRHDRGITTPIYLFSNLDFFELAERTEAAGLDGFILKSEGIEHLVERVHGILYP
ncbi:MAG: response regulator transcription factor [Deltaproteobacteria bacterium]|nr:response regulator transcription factor [Deltaproteobacteria bacterium]